MGEIRMGSLGHIGVVRWICLFFMGWNVSPGAGKALQITERAVIVPEISLIENELEELLSYGLYDPTGEGKRYRECLIEKMLEGSPPMCSEHIKEVSKVIKYGAPGPSPVASSSEASSRILVVYSGANDGVAKGCVYPFEQEPVALVEKGCQEINFTNLNKYHRVYMINAQWLPSYVPATKSIAFSSNQMNFSAEVQQHQSFSPTRGKEMFLLEVKDIPDTKMLSEVKNKNVKAACYSGNKGKFCYVAAGLIPETALFYRGTDCIVVGLEFNCSSFYKKLKPESLQPKSLQAKFRLPTETKPEGIVRLPDDQLCYAACDDEVYYSTDVETCAIMMQAKPYLSGDANEHSPNCPKQFKRTENRINYAVNYGLESLEANDYLKKLIVPYIRTSSFPSPAGGTLGFRFYANPEIRSDKLIPPTEGTPSIRSSTAATGGYTSNDGLYFLDLSRMQVIQHTRVVMSTQLEVLSTEPRKVDNMKLFDELLYGYGREEANCKPPTDKTLQKSLEGLRRHLDQLQDLSVPTMAQYPGSKGRREAMRQLFYEFMFVKSESYRDVLSEMLRYFGISFTKRKIDNAAKNLPGLIDNLEKATMQESGKSLSAEFECAALAQRFSLTKNSRDFHLMVYLEKKLEDDGIYAYAAFIADMVFVAIPENAKLMDIQNCKTLELRNILSDCEKEKANLECEFEIQLHDIQAEHVLKELKLDGYFELLDDIELPGQDSLVFLPNKFTGRDVLNNIISLKNLLPFKTWTDVSNFIVGAAEVSYVLAVRGLCNQEAYAYAMSLSNTYAKDYEKEFARLLKDKFSLQSLSCVWISLIESGESVELESVSITQEVFDLLKSQKLPHLANISGHKLYENVPQTVADITNIEMESYSAVENNFKGQVVFTSNQRLDTMKKFVLEGELYIFDLVWILTGESYCFRHIYSDVWNLGGNGQDTANDCKKICSSPNDICNYIYMRVPAQPAELFEEFGALIEQGSPPETPKLWGYFTVPHDFEATTHELRLFSVDETNTRKLENSPNDKGPSTYTYVFEGLAVNSSSFVITHKNGARGLLRISSGWALIPHTTYDKPFTCRHFHQMIKKKSGAEYAESEVAAEHRFSTTRFSYATDPNEIPAKAKEDGASKHYSCFSYCGANVLSIDLDQKTCEAVQSMDFLLPDRTFDVLDNIETCQPRTLQAEMTNLSVSYLADLIPSPNIHVMEESTTMGERPALIYVSLTNGGGTQKSPCSSLVSRKGKMYFFFTKTLTVETYECFKPWKLTTVSNEEVNTELLTELLGADPGKELLEVIKGNLMKHGDSELINAIRSFSEKPDANSLKVAVVAEAKKVLANATSSAGSESSSQSGGLVDIEVRGDAGEKTSAAQAHDEKHKRDMEGNKNKEGGNNKEEDDKHNQDKHKQNDHKDKDNQSEDNGSDEVQSISEQQNRDSPDKSTAEVPKIASEEIEQPSAGQNGTSVTSDSIYSPKLGKGNVDKDTDDKNSKEENGDKKNNDGVNKDKENKDKDKRNIEVKPIGRSDDTPSERTKPQVSIDLSGTSGEISGEGKNQDSRNAVEKHMDDGSGVALDGRTSKISGSDKNDQSSNSGTAPVNSPQSGSSTKASDEDAKKKLNKEDVESPAKDKSGDDTIVKDPAKNTSKDENKNAGAEHIDISNGGSLESALADEKVTITDDKQSSIFVANSEKIPLESVSNSGSHSGDDLHGKDSDESPGQNNEPPYAPQDSTAPSSSSKLPSGDAVDNNSEIENTKDESEDQNHSKGYKSNDSAPSGSSLDTTLVEDDANEVTPIDTSDDTTSKRTETTGPIVVPETSEPISGEGKNQDSKRHAGENDTNVKTDSFPQAHSSRDSLESNKKTDNNSEGQSGGDKGSETKPTSRRSESAGKASKRSDDLPSLTDDIVDKENEEKENNDGDDKDKEDGDKENTFTPIDGSESGTGEPTKPPGSIDPLGTSEVPGTSSPGTSSPGTAPDGEGKNPDSKNIAVEDHTSSKTDSFPQANSSRDSSESNKKTGNNSEGQLGDVGSENQTTSHGSESARRNSRNSPEAPSSHNSSENHSDTGESDRQPSRNSQEATSHGTRSRSDETTDSSQNSTDTQHDNGDTDDEGTESDKQYAMFLNLLVRRLLWKEEATFQGNRKTDISEIAPTALAFVSSHIRKLETLYHTIYAPGKVHTTEFYSGDVYRQLFYKTHEQDGFELRNKDIEDFRTRNVDLHDMLSYVLGDDCETVGLIFTNWGDMEVKWPIFFDKTAGADPINSVRTLFDLEAFSEPFAQAFSRFNEVRDSRPPAAGNLTCKPPLPNVPVYEYELCKLLKEAVERKLVDQIFKKLIQYLNTDKEELAAFVAECAWRPKAFLAGWKNATSRELNLPFHARNGGAAQSLSSYAEDKERQDCDRIKVHFEALEPLHWDTLKLSSIQRIFSEYTFASALLESEHLQAITTLGLQMPDELFQVRTVLPSVNVIGLAQLRNILGKLEKLKRGFQSNKNKPVSSVPEVPAQIDNWKNDWKHLRVVLMIIKNNREPLHSDEWDALFLSGLAILNGEQRDKISGVLPGKLTMTFEKLTESHQQLLETAISTIKSPDYALTNKVERCVDGSSKMNIWLYLTDKTKQEKVLRSIVPKEPRRLKALGSYSQASVSPFASEYLRRLGDKKSVYHLLIKYYKDATLHIFELIFKGIEGSALKNLVKQTNSELNLLEDTNDIPAKLGDIITKDAKAIRSKFGGDLSFKYVFTDFPGKYDNLAPEPFSPFEPKSAATSAHQAWGYIALCLFSVLLTLT